jgi:hypothetical protein
MFEPSALQEAATANSPTLEISLSIVMGALCATRAIIACKCLYEE